MTTNVSIQIKVPYSEDDELLQRAANLAEKYMEGGRMEKEGAKMKEEAKESLTSIRDAIAASQGQAPDNIVEIQCTPRSNDGKAKKFVRRSTGKRSNISAEKLLAAGVPASIIEICTEHTETFYYMVTEVKA